MKKCSNPACDPAVLFDDALTVCPLCGAALSPDPSSAGAGATAPMTGGTAPAGGAPSGHDEWFIRRFFSRIRCHGLVTDISNKDLFHSYQHKMANTLLFGQPFQFAHQVSQYALRVESLASDSVPAAHTFFLYGDHMGNILPGDEVVITARRDLLGRDVVRKIYNVTTHSRLRPGGIQIPGRPIQKGLRAALFSCALLLVGAVLAAGAGFAELAAVLLMGLGGLAAAVVWLIKFLLKKR